MIHSFGKWCEVCDDSKDTLSIYCDNQCEPDLDTAIIETTSDARDLANFLLEWAEKMEADNASKDCR